MSPRRGVIDLATRRDTKEEGGYPTSRAAEIVQVGGLAVIEELEGALGGRPNPMACEGESKLQVMASLNTIQVRCGFPYVRLANVGVEVVHLRKGWNCHQRRPTIVFPEPGTFSASPGPVRVNHGVIIEVVPLAAQVKVDPRAPKIKMKNRVGRDRVSVIDTHVIPEALAQKR